MQTAITLLSKPIYILPKGECSTNPNSPSILDEIPADTLQTLLPELETKLSRTEELYLLGEKSIMVNELLAAWEQEFAEDAKEEKNILNLYFGWGISSKTQERRLLPILATGQEQAATLLKLRDNTWDVKTTLSHAEAKNLVQELKRLPKPLPSILFQPKFKKEFPTLNLPEGIRILRAESQDLPEIREFLIENAPYRPGTEELHTLSPLRFLLQQEEKQGSATFFFATNENDQILAVICYYQNFEDNMHTRSLVVCDQETWKSNISSALIQKVEAEAKKQGITYLRRPKPKAPSPRRNTPPRRHYSPKP